MKTLTVRLPNALVSEIEAESRARNLSKSDVVRERLTSKPEPVAPGLSAIADLVGSVDGLPPNLGTTRKAALKASGYGRKHSG